MLASMFIFGAMTSCTSDSDKLESGVGTLKLTINTQNKFSENETRLGVDESYYQNTKNYTISITDIDGTPIAGIDDFKADDFPVDGKELGIGTYKITASCGNELDASQNEFLSTGSEFVNIQSDGEHAVTINCSPTCGKVAVKFDSTMDDYFTEYYVVYTTKKATATATKDNCIYPWYLKLDEAGEVVMAKIHLTPKTNYLTDEQKTAGYSEGVITQTYKLLRNKSWTMKIKPNYTTSIGELGISISIDETTNDQEVSIVVPSEWIIK